MTIRKRLRLKGVSSENIAKLVDISPAYVRHIALGTRTPSIPVLARIADALGVDDAELGKSVREWGEGLHTSEGASADPHTPEAQREEVSP